MTRSRFLVAPCLLLLALGLGEALAGEAPAAAPTPPSAARIVEPNVSGAAVPRASSRRPAALRPRAHRSRRGSIAGPVEAANRAALREPERQGFLNAMQVYPWSEGALYRLYAAPGEVSDIALQAGEGLISVAAGDTVRWVIGDTTSGSGSGRRVHILVKPSAVGLQTNLLVTTDRRVYRLALESSARAAMASISWSYPQEELLALRRAEAAAEAAAPVADGVALESLHFGYSIMGDRPPWRPLRAFDDGRRVFIEFPPTLGKSEAPPLFVTGAGGKPELVNYRQRGNYYVVDRLFAVAELRLGEKKQQVVRIVRDGAETGGKHRRGRAS
jgi:type IV secretion system protein VirB9